MNVSFYSENYAIIINTLNNNSIELPLDKIYCQHSTLKFMKLCILWKFRIYSYVHFPRDEFIFISTKRKYMPRAIRFYNKLDRKILGTYIPKYIKTTFSIQMNTHKFVNRENNNSIHTKIYIRSFGYATF